MWTSLAILLFVFTVCDPLIHEALNGVLKVVEVQQYEEKLARLEREISMIRNENEKLLQDVKQCRAEGISDWNVCLPLEVFIVSCFGIAALPLLMIILFDRLSKLSCRRRAQTVRRDSGEVETAL